MFKRWHLYFLAHETVHNGPNETRVTTGNTTYCHEGPIKSMDEINQITRMVEKEHGYEDNAIITSITLLRKTWFHPGV